jgi:hypothetical protein
MPQSRFMTIQHIKSKIALLKKTASAENLELLESVEDALEGPGRLTARRLQEVDSFLAKLSK